MRRIAEVISRENEAGERDKRKERGGEEKIEGRCSPSRLEVEGAEMFRDHVYRGSHHYYCAPGNIRSSAYGSYCRYLGR